MNFIAIRQVFKIRGKYANLIKLEQQVINVLIQLFFHVGKY